MSAQQLRYQAPDLSHYTTNSNIGVVWGLTYAGLVADIDLFISSCYLAQHVARVGQHTLGTAGPWVSGG